MVTPPCYPVTADVIGLHKVNTMKPSLDNAYERVRRTEYHLARIKRELPYLSGPTKPWREVQQGVAVFDRIIGDSITGVPAIFSILVGESIYNLRASLDYLVYELAILDSGMIQKGTQFPIEDTKNGWHGHIPTFLKGLSIKHQAAIECFQPCNGCDWMKTLRKLSNPDKHRTLTVMRLVAHIGKSHSQPISELVQIHPQFTIDITFDDGSPVVETIKELKAHITEVLDSFNPEF